MAKNIEINYNTGNGYEQLWPKTLLGNVMDWNSSIYSKSEISTLINGLANTYYNKNEVNNLLNNAGELKIVTGTRRGTGTGTPSNNQLLFTIQTRVDLFIFFMTQGNSTSWPVGYLRTQDMSEPVISGSEEWMISFVPGNAECMLQFVDNFGRLHFIINANKTSSSISFTFGQSMSGTSAPSAYYLLNDSRRTYTWWGIGK